MIKNEIELLDISGDDSVLNIGSGPIPSTCIILANKTDAKKIIGIDKNKESIVESKKIIKKFDLENKIEIMHSDAKDFSIKNYKAIIIAQGINPHREILEKIAEEMDKDTRVIFRTNSDNDGSLTDNDLFIEDFFKIGNIAYQKQNSLMISIVLLKK